MTRDEILADMEAGSPAFREWVQGQVGEYDDMSATDCAFAQFLKAEGFKDAVVGGTFFYFHAYEERSCRFTDKMRHAINSGENTFEALAERLA